MRANVFTDGRLSSHAGRFVWLAIDTEKEANVALVEKYAPVQWPTLLVVDVTKDEVALRWKGYASVEELGGFLTDGAAAVAGTRDPVAEALAAADTLYAAGKLPDAGLEGHPEAVGDRRLAGPGAEGGSGNPTGSRGSASPRSTRGNAALEDATP